MHLKTKDIIHKLTSKDLIQDRVWLIDIAVSLMTIVWKQPKHSKPPSPLTLCPQLLEPSNYPTSYLGYPPFGPWSRVIAISKSMPTIIIINRKYGLILFKSHSCQNFPFSHDPPILMDIIIVISVMRVNRQPRFAWHQDSGSVGR